MDLLENPVISDLNFWISRFVAEVRRQDGNFYLLERYIKY